MSVNSKHIIHIVKKSDQIVVIPGHIVYVEEKSDYLNIKPITSCVILHQSVKYSHKYLDNIKHVAMHHSYKNSLQCNREYQIYCNNYDEFQESIKYCVEENKSFNVNLSNGCYIVNSHTPRQHTMYHFAITPKLQNQDVNIMNESNTIFPSIYENCPSVCKSEIKNAVLVKNEPYNDNLKNIPKVFVEYNMLKSVPLNKKVFAYCENKKNIKHLLQTCMNSSMNINSGQIKSKYYRRSNESCKIKIYYVAKSSEDCDKIIIVDNELANQLVDNNKNVYEYHEKISLKNDKIRVFTSLKSNILLMCENILKTLPNYDIKKFGRAHCTYDYINYKIYWVEIIKKVVKENNTVEICLKAVKKYDILKCVTNKTEEICLEAIKQCSALRFVEKQTDKIYTKVKENNIDDVYENIIKKISELPKQSDVDELKTKNKILEDENTKLQDENLHIKNLLGKIHELL